MIWDTFLHGGRLCFGEVRVTTRYSELFTTASRTRLGWDTRGKGDVANQGDSHFRHTYACFNRPAPSITSIRDAAAWAMRGAEL